MAIKHAVEAYRQSAYQQLEYKIEGSVGRAGLPFIGGIWPEIKAFGSRIARPFKVVGAWASGGNYPIEDVTMAKIPDDIKDSRYIAALGKVREYGHESADRRAKSVGQLLSFDVTGFFREQRAASYNDSQISRVILPDESDSGFDGIAASSVRIMANSSPSAANLGAGLTGLGSLSPAMAARPLKAFGINV